MEKEKTRNIKLISIFMIILFIVTICSLLGALWSVSLVDEINPQHCLNFTKNMWAFWCCLFILYYQLYLDLNITKLDLNVRNIPIGGYEL